MASDELSKSLFHSQWENEPQKFKTIMKITMEKAKNKMKVKSLGVFEVNLEKFLFILNSAYSMYAVLENMS
jgi:hypothetical protein